MTGKLIVLDGLDGSGKSTQLERVYQILLQKYKKVKLISFPDYQNESSALVRMYLNGELGTDANAVNAYAASSFYAVDRYVSYQKYWKQAYQEGTVILAARYTTSNAIHQMGKLPRAEWDSYLDWLFDYEYKKLGLPIPDQVIFLDMPRDIADQLLLERYHGDSTKKDIHEKDRHYLEQCQQTAAYAAQKGNWTVISCGENRLPHPIAEVTAQIIQSIEECK